MSTVSSNESTLLTLTTENSSINASSANPITQATANLTIGQPPVPPIPAVGLPAAFPTAMPVPFVNSPYAAYNPLAYTGQPIAANPYFPYQYPYATPYNYYQPATTPVLPVTSTPNQPVKNNNEEDKKSKKKKNKQKEEDEDEEDEEDPTVDKSFKKTKANNVLPFWGNEKTMNLNPLILTNIQNSPYFKNDLYQLKTYHEVIDEIYYSVKHLEPWERGSRKVSGQTGLCGSVRGVSAGGIVSTPFCILYKLYTLKLTRKQLLGLLKHKDSPYIRALGFLYIRFTQPPSDFWKWYEPYLEDPEEFEVRSGFTMTIGELSRHMISKLDWCSTLFPRVPIPVQKDLEKQLSEYDKKKGKSKSAHLEDGEVEDDYESRKVSKDTKYSSSGRNKRSRSRSRSRERKRRSRSRSKDRRRYDDRYGKDRSRDRSVEKSKDKSRDKSRDRSREKYRYR